MEVVLFLNPRIRNAPEFGTELLVSFEVAEFRMAVPDYSVSQV